MTITTLPADLLEIGHCVIINHCEQPCGRLVAVIIEITNDKVKTQYLAEEIDARIYSNYLRDITPIESFGVKVRYDSTNNLYWCDPVGDSVAKYHDGQIRPWQERGGIGKYRPKSKVLKLTTHGLVDTE